MYTPRHRAPRPRSARLIPLLLALCSVVISLVAVGGPPSASAATPVPKASCKRIDPNLVHGVCLRYAAKSGVGYTWIGSYRADDGTVFFCIDYLYDSRIVSSAAVVGTDPLRNQFGARIGEAEVAALNYVISTWAPHGSTGSDGTDGAIALIIREVMSDAIRPDGTVVYPPGLKVGQRVAAPIGGLVGGALDLARSMWSQASRYRGPGHLVLAGSDAATVRLGRSRVYRVAVLSAAGHPIPGLTVTFRCRGPIRCPRTVTTATATVPVKVVPTALGRATIQATASAPAADGKLLELSSWRAHAGSTAENHGVQRGWIGRRVDTRARLSVEARVVKGTPSVTTRASSATALPGAGLTDHVTVSGLPAGAAQQVTATLYGPFPTPPGPDSCVLDARAGQVSLRVAADGTITTPPVVVDEPGYYVWTESLPGDDRTNPVTTPCGISEETTLVQPPRTREQRPLTVRTVASARHLLIGRPVRDLVRVSGLPEDASVEVRWTLLGPLAPQHGSCAGLDWSHAPVLARGVFEADHDGRYATPPTRVRAPGCVTFTEHVAATPATSAVDTRAGETAETVLVTRPAVPVVPEIASGPARAGR